MQKHNLDYDRVREELDELLPQPVWATNKSVAVILPCYNEGAAIEKVVNDFRKALPSARIYVYDNNSTDNTRQAAEAAGAIVCTETLRGKGNVVRRMFADIEADIYVMADGDGTYDSTAAGKLIDKLVSENLDMVVGTRLGGGEEAYRRGHQYGNQLFNRIVTHLFGEGFTDIFSGYRILSRRFAKSFPSASQGFEIETELSVHALDLRIASAEIDVPYGARMEGTESKLNTYRDGARILWTIFRLYKETQPLGFFGASAIALGFTAFGLSLPLAITYLQTGLVPQLPTAILCMGLMQLSFLSAVCGIILNSISHGRRELKRMRYLEMKAVAEQS